MTFARNLAKWDRTARTILGGLLILGAVTGIIGVWGWLGLVLLGTAIVSFCPLYKALGLNTCDDC